MFVISQTTTQKSLAYHGKFCDTGISVAFVFLTLVIYLLLHVPVSLLLSLTEWSRRAEDGHLVQLEELLTQAVLQVLVQLAAGRRFVKQVKMLTLTEKGHMPNKKMTCIMSSHVCLHAVFDLNK